MRRYGRTQCSALGERGSPRWLAVGMDEDSVWPASLGCGMAKGLAMRVDGRRRKATHEADNGIGGDCGIDVVRLGLRTGESEEVKVKSEKVRREEDQVELDGAAVFNGSQMGL